MKDARINGETRTQALAQVLRPLFESGFSPYSYGFREGRNAHQAVRHVEACWKEVRRHAVDCDLTEELVVNRAKSKAAPLKACAFL